MSGTYRYKIGAPTWEGAPPTAAPNSPMALLKKRYLPSTTSVQMGAGSEARPIASVSTVTQPSGGGGSGSQPHMSAGFGGDTAGGGFGQHIPIQGYDGGVPTAGTARAPTADDWYRTHGNGVDQFWNLQPHVQSQPQPKPQGDGALAGTGMSGTQDNDPWGVNALTSRADGGDLDPEEASTVNEVRPEDWISDRTGQRTPIGDGSPGVFVPNEPGTVIPESVFSGARDDAGSAAPQNPYRAQVTTPPHSWENNRYARAAAAAKQLKDFYDANPEAVKQRGQEALDAQLASDGIHTFATPGGPTRTLSNQYGTGFSSPMTPDAPHRVADEKGEIATAFLTPAAEKIQYQKDPLEGTPWGTKSGIKPAEVSASDLDHLIARGSQAAQTWPEITADDGKPSVATQFADWSLTHPAPVFDDPTVGVDYSRVATPELSGTGGARPQDAGNYRGMLQSLMTGDPRVDRNMMRFVRTPQGSAMLASHALEQQKMQHQEEIWDRRTKSSEDRADKRNETTLQKQAMMDENHQKREHDYLSAKYGAEARKTGKPEPFEHKWEDGTVTTGFVTPNGQVHIVPRGSTARGSGSNEPKIHNVPMPSPNDPTKTINVPHYMKTDAEGNPYLVPVPQGQPSAATTPAGLFPKKK